MRNRWLAALTLTIILLLSARVVYAAFVEVTGCQNTSSISTVTCTLNTVAGNIVFLGAEENGTDPLTILSTGTGDSWTSITTVPSPCINGSQTIAGWEMIPVNSTTGDVATVTAVGGGVFFMETAAGTYSGAATSSPIRNTSPCAHGTSGSIASGTFTATSGDLVTCYALAGGGSITAGSGFTMNWFNSFGGEEFQTLSGTSANCQYTQTSGNWVVFGVAIKPAGGGSTTATPQQMMTGVGF